MPHFQIVSHKKMCYETLVIIYAISYIRPSNLTKCKLSPKYLNSMTAERTYYSSEKFHNMLPCEPLVANGHYFGNGSISILNVYITIYTWEIMCCFIFFEISAILMPIYSLSGYADFLYEFL